ncbi:MAG: hypothetical protein AAGA60_31720 [Cyanobacteria bacterium P01_E01_bin.42]
MLIGYWLLVVGYLGARSLSWSIGYAEVSSASLDRLRLAPTRGRTAIGCWL